MTDRIDFGAEPWQAIPRRILRDARLSAAAKGGLVTLLSHEEGWVRSAIATLMHENQLGRAGARNIMRELVAAGYAELEQHRGEGGRFTTAYTVYAIPQVQADKRASHRGRSTGGGPPGAVHTPAVVEPQDVEPLDVDPALQHLSEKRARKRDETFDALSTLDGGPAGMTPTALHTVGVALAQIRRATPQVNPHEIARRTGNYRRLGWAHGEAPSASALAKHWARCDVVIEPLDRASQIHAEAEELRRAGL